MGPTRRKSKGVGAWLRRIWGACICLDAEDDGGEHEALARDRLHSNGSGYQSSDSGWAENAANLSVSPRRQRYLASKDDGRSGKASASPARRRFRIRRRSQVDADDEAGDDEIDTDTDIESTVGGAYQRQEGAGRSAADGRPASPLE